MNALEANISSSVAQEIEEVVKANDFCELLDEKDDAFAFDISNGIMHYDQSEPDTDNDSKSFEETVIFQGSQITISADIALILSFSVRFSLSSVALSDLLLLILFLLPKDSNLCKTLHYFKKHFQTIKNPIVYHLYCNNCYLKILNHSLQFCSKCRNDLTFEDNKGYLIDFLIINQVKLFFKRPGFYDNLQFRFNHQKKYSDNIEDIHDGCIYKKHFKNYGFLSNTDNISFLWNTDEVPLFKSSKISIWSIFLVINELEPKHRYKSENMLFAGMRYS